MKQVVQFLLPGGTEEKDMVTQRACLGPSIKYTHYLNPFPVLLSREHTGLLLLTGCKAGTARTCSWYS